MAATWHKPIADRSCSVVFHIIWKPSFYVLEFDRRLVETTSQQINIEKAMVN